MQEQKVILTVPPDYNGTPITLIVREGEAEVIKDNVLTYKQDVTIQSIKEFTEKRYPDTTLNASGVIEFSVDPQSPFIKFLANPENKEAIILNSKLVINPELQAWGINADLKFTPEQLRKQVMKLSHLFAEPAAAKALISNLRNFQVKFEDEVVKADNRQGGKEDSIKQALTFIKGSAPQIIDLKLPLFKNTPPVDLQLTIEIDAENKQPVYSFYSFELTELLVSKAKEYIEEIVNPLRTKFVCLEK